MPARLTTEEFIKKAREAHGDKYDYSKAEYKNGDTPIIITCPVHGEFSQKPRIHLEGRGCQKCAMVDRANTCLNRYGIALPFASEEARNASGDARRHTTEQFIEQARKVHDDFYDYSQVEYVGSKTEVKIICPIHGVFMQTPNKHLAGQGCSNPECVSLRKKSTFRDKYGVDNPMQNDAIQEKTKKTCVERYGVEHPSQNDDIKQKMKKTFISHYGVENPMQDSDVKKKARQTCMNRYGVENSLMSDEIRIKAQATNIKRFGVPYPYQNKEIMQKVIDKKHDNHTFNTSKPEDELYELLASKFGKDDVFRQYSSDVYPFDCDFYIKSRDMYIELNGFITHGGHWFDENSKSDLAKLKRWQQKGTLFYDNAIDTWSRRDVMKREIAHNNNLNYVVFWDKKLRDVNVWLQANCPDRRDWQ